MSPVWLSISLFVSPHQKGRLLCGISSFLSLRSVKTRLLAYRIFFNDDGGSNVRLALLSEPPKAEKLAQKADSYFKDFFAGQTVDAAENTGRQTLFLNFNNNTVQYGLFRFKSKNYDSQTLDFYHKFSQIILTSLKRTEANDQILFAFCYQLHYYLVSCAKTRYNSLSEGDFNEDINISKLYPSLIGCSDSAYLQHFHWISRQEKTFSSKSLLQWKKICSDLFGRNDLNLPARYVAIICRLRDYINDCFCPANDVQQVLNYAITQACSKPASLLQNPVTE